MSTYTVLESGTYRSLDQKASFFWQAGTTTVRPRIQNSGTGTGTFRMAQATLLNLTQLGLV